MLHSFIDFNGNLVLMLYNNIIDTKIYTNNAVVYKTVDNSIIITSSEPYYNTDIYNYKLYSLPIVSSYNNFFNVNNDPELRKKVVKYFYKKYKEIWMPFSYEKIFKYFTKENDKITFVKSRDDYIKNDIKDKSEKKNFILKNIFGKHEMLIFLDRFIRKNNLNWYDIQKNNQSEIKSEIYKKIKMHIEKIISKKK